MDAIEVTGSSVTGSDKILTRSALAFIEDLAQNFTSTIELLLAVRKKRHLIDFDFGFHASIAEDWKCAPLPAELLDRRVEITGPPTRKMVINALNSGANVYMADFEDSCCPTWDNMVSGQVNLYDAVRRAIDYTDPTTGKCYALSDKPAVLMVRPRGWHLNENNVRLWGKPIPGCLVDFGLFMFHNAKELVERGSAPYFYLPKMESHLEAKVWNDIFVKAQEMLNIPRGTVKATCLIETLPAVFEMDRILYALRDHAAGLNCGRWDYIFSFIKKRCDDPAAVLPDRSTLTMDKAFLKGYAELLIQTCHKRGVHAMGGMAAQIPIKGDTEANERAMAKVRADKQREASNGHDGTWVAHPGLVQIAKEAFKDCGPNQINKPRTNIPVTREELLLVPMGPRTEEGLRHNIRVSVQYIESWLRGNGCVPLYDLMEDAATAEISRAQVWQQLHHSALIDNVPLSLVHFNQIVDQESKALVGGRYEDALSLFRQLSTSHDFIDFLTVPAYKLL